MAAITKSLYDTDFVAWTARTAELLRQGRFDEVDRQHLAEEIEDLGRYALKDARFQLLRMLTRWVEHKIEPARYGAGWRGLIVNARHEVLDALDDSPSLRQRLTDDLSELYCDAVQDVLEIEKLSGRRAGLGIPGECPFSLAQLLDDDLGWLRT